MVVPINKKRVMEVLEGTGVVCVVGIYGSGKSLVVNWLVSEHAQGLIVRVSFKDLPIPSEDDIPVVCGDQTWTKLHARWRRVAEKAHKGGKGILIVIEEAQQLLENGDKLWQMLASLRYYQREHVQIVLTAQPAILAATNIQLKHLLRGSLIYPRRFNMEEIQEIVGDTPYLTAIERLSHGHYGTVKYINQMIAKKGFSAPRLTEVQLTKWAREEGINEYFADIMWGGMSSGQQRVVRQFLSTHGRVDEKQKEVRELIETGLLWRGGKGLHWYADWTLPFVREYVSYLPKPQRLSEVELGQFSQRERKLIVILSREQRVVSYDELADTIWVRADDEYSLWALTRLVSRVKKKLTERGYQGSIVNERGLGYKWIV